MKKMSIMLFFALMCLFLVMFTGGCAVQTATDAEKEQGVIEPTDDVDAAVIEEGKIEEDVNLETGDDEEELRESALSIAIAWFVGPETEYTSDQFDWAVESLVQDNEGVWWARVSATPRDPSLESEQIYVNRPVGMSLFGPVCRGTEIDPSTDDRFPEEVGDKL